MRAFMSCVGERDPYTKKGEKYNPDEKYKYYHHKGPILTFFEIQKPTNEDLIFLLPTKLSYEDVLVNSTEANAEALKKVLIEKYALDEQNISVKLLKVGTFFNYKKIAEDALRLLNEIKENVIRWKDEHALDNESCSIIYYASPGLPQVRTSILLLHSTGKFRFDAIYDIQKNPQTGEYPWLGEITLP